MNTYYVARQLGIAGTRVVELEGHPPGNTFSLPAKGPGRIPWTIEQETARVLAPDNPFRRADPALHEVSRKFSSI